MNPLHNYDIVMRVTQFVEEDRLEELDRDPEAEREGVEAFVTERTRSRAASTFPSRSDDSRAGRRPNRRIDP